MEISERIWLETDYTHIPEVQKQKFINVNTRKIFWILVETYGETKSVESLIEPTEEDVENFYNNMNRIARDATDEGEQGI